MVLEPGKQYKSLDKVAMSIEKLLLVTTTVPVDPSPPPLPPIASLLPVNECPGQGQGQRQQGTTSTTTTTTTSGGTVTAISGNGNGNNNDSSSGEGGAAGGGSGNAAAAGGNGRGGGVLVGPQFRAEGEGSLGLAGTVLVAAGPSEKEPRRAVEGGGDEAAAAGSA